MATQVNPICILLAVGVVLLIGGLWMIFRTFRPRRQGDELRCRRCDYQLQGIQSPRCPECGNALTSANQVRGHRPRRLGMAVWGLLCILLGLISAAPFVISETQNIDWYQYRPTNWVLGDLASPATESRAWAELNRRISLGKLSPAQQSALADHCIALLSASGVTQSDVHWQEIMRQDAKQLLSPAQRLKLIDWALVCQRSTAVNGSFDTPMDWLGDQLAAGRLPADRRQAFLSHMLNLRLQVRPQIAVGAPLPYSVSIDMHGPSRGYWYRNSRGEIAIDGNTVRDEIRGYDGGSISTSDNSSSTSQVSVAKQLQPGRHVLTLRKEETIGAGQMPYTVDPTPNLFQQSPTLVASFTVLPAGKIDPIDDVSDPTTDSHMKGAFDVTRLEMDGQGCNVDIKIKEPTENFAFDVLVVLNGQEKTMGSIDGLHGATGKWSVGTTLFKFGKLRAVDVILRSSDNVARTTPNLTRIWKGEIRFKNVVIEQPTTQP